MNVLDMFRLDGKRALITGGGRGIGRQIALGFAQAGADVAIVSRTEAELQSAASEIALTTGRQCLAYQCDVTDESAVGDTVGQAIRDLGQIDILVNNAGMQIRHPVTDFSLEDWRAVIDGNLTSTFLCTRAVLPVMIQQTSGRIINLGSVMGLIARPDRSAYCAAKAAVQHFTKATAVEVAPHGVTVNAIAPGPVITESNREAFSNPETLDFLRANTPLGRWPEAPDLRGVALMLASDAGAFITGQVIAVDGGWTAQ